MAARVLTACRGHCSARQVEAASPAQGGGARDQSVAHPDLTRRSRTEGQQVSVTSALWSAERAPALEGQRRPGCTLEPQALLQGPPPPRHTDCPCSGLSLWLWAAHRVSEGVPTSRGHPPWACLPVPCDSIYPSTHALQTHDPSALRCPAGRWPLYKLLAADMATPGPPLLTSSPGRDARPRPEEASPAQPPTLACVPATVPGTRTFLLNQRLKNIARHDGTRL